MAAKDDNKKTKSKKELDATSLATWARLRAAGKAPIGGKPYGAEISKDKPSKKKKGEEK